MKHIYNTILIKYSLAIIIAIVFLSTIPSSAQTENNQTFLDRFAIGISGGFNFPKMVYSDPNLASYESSLLIGGELGVFSEIQLSKRFSIRPEVIIVDKGQFIDYTNLYYKFNPYYLDWRLPFQFNFGKPNGVRPYLMVAPAMGFVFGGTIYLEDETGSYGTDITDANISPIELSLSAGGGLKIPLKFGKVTLLAGLEVAYNMGITNTYSTQEMDGTANSLNLDYNSIDGSRKNRGLSTTVSLAIPFSNFKKKTTTPKPKPIKVITKNTVTEPPHEPAKSCYTIEEINVLIDAKKNVNNKVICMINLKFDFNKSTLDKDSKTYLDNVVKLLDKVSSMKMKISGHTDNMGTDEYNLDLSKKRAAAVYNYLTSKGISSSRLSYDYYGATRPLFNNDSEEHRAQNRRVEFEIIDK
jgi:outer membrane protein OmpA-like peptidoglycan-associated protein